MRARPNAPEHFLYPHPGSDRTRRILIDNASRLSATQIARSLNRAHASRGIEPAQELRHRSARLYEKAQDREGTLTLLGHRDVSAERSGRQPSIEAGGGLIMRTRSRRVRLGLRLATRTTCTVEDFALGIAAQKRPSEEGVWRRPQRYEDRLGPALIHAALLTAKRFEADDFVVRGVLADAELLSLMGFSSIRDGVETPAPKPIARVVVPPTAVGVPMPDIPNGGVQLRSHTFEEQTPALEPGDPLTPVDFVPPEHSIDAGLDAIASRHEWTTEAEMIG